MYHLLFIPRFISQAFAFAVISLLMLAAAHSASPTIAKRAHPFDPDWPEVKLILANKCTACHRPGTERVDLTSYDSVISALADGERIVLPGNAADSMLWQYVEWNVTASANSTAPDEAHMPEEKLDWLTAGQLKILHRWISNGALQYRLPQQCNIRPLMEIDFPSAKQCGGCHPRKYDEWSRSMHAYAQHSPTFAALNSALQERTGGTLGTFCSRCHTPIGTALGENALMQNIHRSRISMEGITCVVCHRRSKPHYKASGRVAVEPGDLQHSCVYGPFEHAVFPETAHSSKALPYLKSSNFCAECHDVFNPTGVRLEEAFSEWQNSPAAKKGFTCQHCHMGPVQGVPVLECNRPLGRAATVPGIPPEQLPLRRLTDHTFAGPDYSLLPNTEFPHKLDWMYETDYRDPSKLTPYQQRTLREIRLKNRESLRIADAKRHELLRNSSRLIIKHTRLAQTNSDIRINARVQSLTAGHNLPTGFSAERQLWVSIEVTDPFGRCVFVSGDLDKEDDLRDNHSHEVLAGKESVDKYLLNFQNKFVTLSHKGTERSVVIPVNRNLVPVNVLRPARGISASFGRPNGFRIAKGSIPPMQSMGRDYPVSLPNQPGHYRVRARLNFRHLPPTLLDHLGAGALKPQIEIVVIDSYEGFIEVR